MWRLTISIAALAVLTACGSGSSSTPNAPASTSAPAILHMRGIDISQADFTTYARQLLLEPSAHAFCTGLAGLSDQQIADTLHSNSAKPLTAIVGATPAPGQTPWPSDALAAAGIVRAECKRIAP